MALFMTAKPTIQANKNFFGVPHKLVTRFTIGWNVHKSLIKSMSIMQCNIRLPAFFSNSFH